MDNKTIIKTAQIERDVGHLSVRVEKLCNQIDIVSPKFSELMIKMDNMNTRMLDDIARRESSERIVIKLVDQMRTVNSIQEKHSEQLVHNNTDISDLKDIITSQKMTLNSSKIIWKIFAALTIFILACFSSWYQFDEYRDRNSHQRNIEMMEFDQKKKNFDYTREKYLIRNGITNG